LPDHRTGRNTTYTLKDAILSAFAVFFMQSPSFPWLNSKWYSVSTGATMLRRCSG